MTAEQIDAYLAGLAEPQRSALQSLRDSIRRAAPDAEECISYSVPGFRENGKVIAGFAAFTNHNAYLPHSGAVLGAVGDAIAGYEHTLSSLHFPVGETLPDELVARLVQEKRDILGPGR